MKDYRICLINLGDIHVKTLSIWNFALIEHVQIDLDKGLNILTGETGAGKSILLGALGMVIGRRTNIDAIRSGCEFMRVEAVLLWITI